MTVFASVFALTPSATAMAREGKPTNKVVFNATTESVAIPPALDIERLMEEHARHIQAVRHRQAVRRRAIRRARAKRREARRLVLSRATAQPVVLGTAPSGTLQAIAQCESHGNPRAISFNGQYRGKYQFSRSTWQSVGGSGDPAAASEAEQDRRAAILYKTGGPGHWPVCGR